MVRSIFPLKPRGKVPLGSLVPRGFLDASRDPAVIREWWRIEPKANIGIATGGGLFVVDLDDSDAVSWFANACGRHGAPKTLTVRTSRGFHVFFACAADVPNSAGRLAPGVDIRGEGGYVVAAPSIHPSGHVYAIARDLPIAEAPRRLVDDAMPDPVPMPSSHGVPRDARIFEDAKLRAIPGILSLVANARQGERNRITFWAACRFDEMVRDGLITQGLAEDLLLQSASRCGLTGMEILRTARSASRRGASLMDHRPAGNVDELEARLRAAKKGNGEAKPPFPLVAWKDIAFDLEEEWRVETLLPLARVACLYGGPSVKTFVLLDLFARMARGGFWGGREVKQCPVVYVAAEGGNGIKKRIAGLKKVAAEKGLPADIPFHLIPAAPNLGTGNGDCKKLIADIEATGAQPGAIAIDTTTQALGGADENGAGMDALVVNATVIANYFQCLVVLVHHTPVADDDRLRGKTSLLGGLDVSIISKREKGSLVATMTIKKMRDEDETQSFTVNLVRVVLGKTKKGREVSTLVVATVDPGAAEAAKTSRKLPDSATNALSALRYALDEVGEIPPASNHTPRGQKAVSPKQWREYANMTSTLPEGDTRDKNFERGCERLKADKIVGILGGYVWEA
jgi:hypothetical protein